MYPVPPTPVEGLSSEPSPPAPRTGRLGDRYLLSSILLGMDIGFIGEILKLSNGMSGAWPIVFAAGIGLTMTGRYKLRKSGSAESRLRWSDLTILGMTGLTASIIAQSVPLAGPYLIMTNTAATVAYLVFAWNKPSGWPLRESPAQKPAL
jgi:hypothetical protein